MSGRWSTYYLLLTTYYLLPTTCYLLLATYYRCARQVYLRGCDEEGTSMAEQWSIVGDT